jgi:hypothetical protein
MGQRCGAIILRRPSSEIPRELRKMSQDQSIFREGAPLTSCETDRIRDGSVRDPRVQLPVDCAVHLRLLVCGQGSRCSTTTSSLMRLGQFFRLARRFSRLREQFWMTVFDEAAKQNRSLIFTFAPEPTVARDFPDRARVLIERNGGQIIFVALELPREEQERRLVAEGRAAFGKMRNPSLLRTLRPQFDARMASMLRPALPLDVANLTPSESAYAISRVMSA